MNRERVVNYLETTGQGNKGGDQYAIHIEHGIATPVRFLGKYDQDSQNPHILGQTQIRSDYSDNGAALPHQVSRIVLNTTTIAADGYRLEEVAAHELGHACSVKHHGDIAGNDLKVSKCVIGSFTLASSDCRRLKVMTDGTKHSGTMTCIMRYEFIAIGIRNGNNMPLCDSDCKRIDGDNTLPNSIMVLDRAQGWISGGFRAPIIRQRNIFCTDNGSSSPYGRTAPGRGSCYYQLKVKCW